LTYIPKKKKGEAAKNNLTIFSMPMSSSCRLFHIALMVLILPATALTGCAEGRDPRINFLRNDFIIAELAKLHNLFVFVLRGVQK
jgi:hypothetical protein